MKQTCPVRLPLAASALLGLVFLVHAAPPEPAPAGQPAAAAQATAADDNIMLHGIFAKLAATPVLVEGRHLALLDLQSGIPAATLEAVAEGLQRNLSVPVRVKPAAGPTPTAAGLAVLRREPAAVFAAVVLAALPAAECPALALSADERLVVVNVTPLAPSDQLALRIERQAMRGIGLVYGLALGQDPFSVMRPLEKGIADLDSFSRSFNPDESLLFNRNAEARGFPVMTNMLYIQKVHKGLMPPINPDNWPVWEKKNNNKSARETFLANGFDPDQIAAEYRRLIQEGKVHRTFKPKPAAPTRPAP